MRLDAVEITVIDEADHMADLGFLPGVTRILTATPAGGQRLLFSATLDNGVDKLVNRFLRNEVSHSVDEANSPVAAMTHHVFHVAGRRRQEGSSCIELASGTGRRILFMRTKHQARKLAKQLTDAGVPSVDLHGNLSQPRARPQPGGVLRRAAPGCWSRPTSPRAACTSTRSNSSCTSTRPSSTRPICTAPGRTARAGSAGDVVTVVLPEQRRDTAGAAAQARRHQRQPQDVAAIRRRYRRSSARSRPTRHRGQACARSEQARVQPVGGPAS